MLEFSVLWPFSCQPYIFSSSTWGPGLNNVIREIVQLLYACRPWLRPFHGLRWLMLIHRCRMMPIWCTDRPKRMQHAWTYCSCVVFKCLLDLPVLSCFIQIPSCYIQRVWINQEPSLLSWLKMAHSMITLFSPQWRAFLPLLHGLLKYPKPTDV